MKKLAFLVATLALFALSAPGQTPCVSGRYNVKAFAVDTLIDIVYGRNVNSSGLQQNLTCDIYLPKADSCSARPVLILAHGGTFLVGNKDIIDVKVLANEFAKRGYVCISMNYRLGIRIIGGGSLQEEFAAAVWRGMQDGRAMVRYLRRSADQLGNPYAIDTKSIYMGGSSAGAFIALNVAFIDQPSEIPKYVDTTAIGGIEGNSGSPGYSSKIKGVVNLCGGMPVGLDPMNNNTVIPLLSVHGTRDNTVPYKCDSFDFAGFNVERVCGSFAIDSMAKINGNASTLYTMVNEGHVPWLNSNGIQFIPSKKHLFDSAEVLIEEFLFNQLVANPFVPQPGEMFEIRQLGRNISLRAESSLNQIEIFDLSGKVLWRKDLMNREAVIQIPSWIRGLVLVRVLGGKGMEVRKIYFDSSR